MATDYAKLKNDELQNLLKQRSLPHTGKKADMVARLQEDDAKQPAPAGGAAPTTAPAAAQATKEDEIDWDDGADASTQPAAAAVAAGGQGRVANPAAVPNQTAGEDPSSTTDLSAKAPAADAATAEKAETKPAVDFTSGLKHTTEIEELERRLARGAKFGTLSDEEKAEIQRKIDRARKFGTDNSSKGLNEALPERPLGKRRREGGEDGGRGGKRGGGAAGRGSGRGGRGTGTGRETQAQEKGRGGWMSEKDREAAEKRKNRFAAVTS